MIIRNMFSFCILLYVTATFLEIRSAPYSSQDSLLSLLSESKDCVSRNPNIIKFYLYNNPADNSSRQEIVLNDESSLQQSGFLADVPLKLLIHGYAEDNFDPKYFPENVKNEYLRDQKGSLNKNVIVVDLGTLTKPNFPKRLTNRAYSACYVQAALNTNIIGKHIADMVEFLIKSKKTTPTLLHIIGDNLGVHIAGFVGNEISRRLQTKISRITAIDAAMPGFRPHVIASARPMTTNDADFVDAVSSINQLAFGGNDQIGHADFFNLFVQPASMSGVFGESKMDIDDMTSLEGPLIESYTSFYFAKSIGRSDIVGSSMDGEAIFGENCKPGTQGMFFVCFSMEDDRPCRYRELDDAYDEDESPGKALVKGVNSVP